MNIKFSIILIFFLATTTFSAKALIVKGYYITLNGDTVNTRFKIKDLFELHLRATAIDSSENLVSLTPDNIKSFCFRTNHFIERDRGPHSIDHASDETIIRKGYLHKRKTFSVDDEINAPSLLDDSTKKYKSVDIGNGKRIFLSIENNDKSEHLQSAVFYTKLNPDKPYLVTSIWLLLKDNQVVERNNRKLNDWVSETISDYKTLSTLVKNKKINVFPWDFKLVAEDYNTWVVYKPDTTLYLKGLIDAQNHYSVIAPCAASYVAGTAFFLPGLFTAVIVSHTPKEQKIKVPEKLLLKNESEYKRGFQHKAYDKKYRAAAKGAILGGLTCIVLLIVFA